MKELVPKSGHVMVSWVADEVRQNHGLTSGFEMDMGQSRCTPKYMNVEHPTHPCGSIGQREFQDSKIGGTLVPSTAI